MDNDEKKITPEGEESPAENEESSAPVHKGSMEGMQSADAMFGQEAAISGIIPGLTDRCNRRSPDRIP